MIRTRGIGIKQKTLFGDDFEDWDFSKAETTYITHGIHPYPARMIPQIAKRLILRYSKINTLVVDPFSGSGTVNLESMLNRRYSYGFDVNPLAHLIEKVKTTYIEDEKLDKIIIYFQSELTKKNGIGNENKLPEIPNISIWFKEKILEDLLYIKSTISIFKEDDKLTNLLNLIFSKTISDVACIDKDDNPYFIRSLKAEKLASFNPDARQAFLKNLYSITQEIRKLSKIISKENLFKFEPKFFLQDARKSSLKNREVNAVITSPPYGEEKNTMSYMRFAKLSLYWLGWTPKELNELGKSSLGCSNGGREIKSLASESLNQLIAELEKNSQQNRAKEVILFFQDYYELIKKTYNWLSKNGHICIVIGNRSAKGLPVLNDQISKELGDDIGFSHVITYHRKIPHKVLPKHDDKTILINAESIVIMKK